MFVIGDGDCGQFGLGEDLVEAPRPLPTAADGQQVRPLIVHKGAYAAMHNTRFQHLMMIVGAASGSWRDAFSPPCSRPYRLLNRGK